MKWAIAKSPNRWLPGWVGGVLKPPHHSPKAPTLRPALRLTQLLRQLMWCLGASVLPMVCVARLGTMRRVICMAVTAFSTMPQSLRTRLLLALAARSRCSMLTTTTAMARKKFSMTATTCNTCRCTATRVAHTRISPATPTKRGVVVGLGLPSTCRYPSAWLTMPTSRRCQRVPKRLLRSSPRR